jgi:hypothetical protein
LLSLNFDIGIWLKNVVFSWLSSFFGMILLDPDLASCFGGLRYFEATSVFARIEWGLIA